jgi:hypothetical protein
MTDEEFHVWMGLERLKESVWEWVFFFAQGFLFGWLANLIW